MSINFNDHNITTSGTLTAASGHFTSLVINDSDFDSNIDNRVTSLLVGGSGIDISYNEQESFLTVSYTGAIVSNYGDNRLLTSDGTSTGINAESNVVIDGSGNVGIGTSSPSSHLHVLNTTTSEEQVIIAEVGGGFSNGAGISFRRSTVEMGRINADYFDGMTFHVTPGAGVAATERMRITSAGNVGIGTTDPAILDNIKFSVVGSTAVLSTVTQNNVTGNSIYGGSYTQHQFKSESAEAALIQVGGSGFLYGGPGSFNIWNNSNAAVTIATNNTERMRIASNGDTQIGGSNVVGLRYFDVRNTDSTLNSGSIIRLITRNAANTTDTSVDLLKYNNGLFAIVNNDSGSITLNTGGSERMRVDASGNVGIGTTGPSYKLDVFNANIRSGYANNSALLVTANSTVSTGASIAIQQLTVEGWTAIFADYEPYAEWGIYHDNPNGRFDFTAGDSTNNLRSYSVVNRSGSTRTAYAKVSILQSSGDLLVGGSVGIGTASPSQKLHLNGGILRISGGGANSNGEINLDSGTQYDGLQLRKESSTLWGIKSVTAGNDMAVFVDNINTRGIYIKTGTGNVGIGTASPQTPLHIIGTLRFGDWTSITYTDGNGRASWYGNAVTNTYLQSEAASRITQSVGEISFHTAAAGTAGGAITWGERFRLDNTGSAWIKSTRAWNDTIPTLNIGNDGDGRLQTRHIWGKSFNSAAAEALFLQFGNGSNHVQIGNVGQGSNLYVGGDIYANGYFGGAMLLYGASGLRRGVYQITDWNQATFPDVAFLSSENATTNAPTTDYTYGVQTSFHRNGPNYRTQFVTSLYGNNAYWFRQLRDSAGWSTWVQMLHSGNYNSYSPTLTGTGASGTWGISITGGLTGTAINLGYSVNAVGISYGGHGGPQIQSQGGGAAMMSFHRPGAYAVNFGLDSDNVLKVGGWSLGANSYPIIHSGNYNSYAPTLTGGNASGTWAINVTGTAGSISGFGNPTTAVTANTIMYRDGNADTSIRYLYSQYLYMSHDVATRGGDTIFYSSTTDNFIRKNNATGMRQALDVPTRAGGSAYGTWSINITGSAGGLNSGNYISRSGSSGNANTDFSNTPAGTVRHNGDDANLVNSPGNVWWFYDNYRHSNGTNLWGTQIAWGWEDNANRLAQRNVSAGNWSDWVYYVREKYNGSVKAWCRFDGTAASPIPIAKGYNVTNITRLSTGNYQVNLSISIANADYCAVASATVSSARVTGVNNTQVFVDCLTSGGSFVNAAQVHVVLT